MEMKPDNPATAGIYWLETEAVDIQTSLQRQYGQAIQSESNWQQQAEAATEKGDRDSLAEALAWKKICNQTIAIKKAQIDAQVIIVELLKQYLILLESQMDEYQSYIDTNNTPAG